MDDTSHFGGPNAQSPEQRAQVLTRMQQAMPRLRKPLSPHVRQLHGQYLAGALGWVQVCQRLSLNPVEYRPPTY